MSHEFKAARGQRQKMDTELAPFPAPPGTFLLKSTQLIRAQSKEHPRQWMVTMMPPTTQSGVLPYMSTFDAGPYVPGSGDYSAPVLPDVFAALQVALDWGAGGIRYQTRFDYPAIGGTFGVVADMMDVNVQLKPSVGQPIAYNPEDVPVVGAFYVDGAPSDPVPMSWLESPQDLAPEGGNDANYSVKPFSKYLNVGMFATQIVDTPGALLVQWLNTSGSLLSQNQLQIRFEAAYEAFRRIRVPRQATVVRFVNLGLRPITVYPEWEISIA